MRSSASKSLARLILLSVVASCPLFAATAASAAESAVAAPVQPRCRWGDPAQLPDQPGFDERAFLSTFKPCSYREEPEGRNDDALMWMAMPLPSPAKALRDPAAFLPGLSGGAFEVWFGGERVYGTGTIVPGGSVKPAHQEGYLVRLPPAAVGKEILIRVQACLPVAVEPPEVGERADLMLEMARAGAVTLVIASMAIVLGLFALLFGVLGRERSFQGFGALALSTGLYVLFEENLVAAVYGSTRFGYFVVMMASLAIPASLADFVMTSISSKPRRWLGYVRTLALAAVVVGWLGILAGLRMTWVLYPWAPVALLVCGSVLTVSVLEVRKGNREAWYFLGGMAIFVGSLVLELFSALHGGRNGGASAWGAAATLGSNLAILVRRYVVLGRLAQEQAAKLEAREAEVRRFADDLASWATRLGEAVQGLRSAAEAQAEALREQGRALAEAQVTTSEIGQASSITKAKADEVLGGASRAEAAGRATDAVIAQTFSGLDAVRSAVGATAHQAAQLGDHSAKLVGVVTAVKDLASQSRLMALNAGLEAARAGEQGRGFGVVAGEMRRLAEASAGSAEEVAKALKEIHGAVTETVRLADGGARDVEAVVDKIHSSGDQLREVAGIAAAAGTNAREIAAAVSQQDMGVREVLDALRVLDAQAAGTTAALETADTAAARVQEVVAGLMEAAERARARV